MSGFLLHVEGCPIAFATTACPVATMPFSGVEQVNDSLDEPSGTISYLLNPVSAELSCGQLGFVLHDFEHDGQPLVASLITQRLADIRLTRLTATLSSTATTFTVADGSALDTLPRTVWIGTEAIRCQSRSGNTITVASGGRGYLGTRATAHVVDTATLAQPAVYSALQRFDKRRCVLYRVSDSGACTAVWRGHVTNGPRLSTRDQASIELQAEHVWSRYKSAVLGRPDAACTLRGFNMSGINVQAQNTNVPFYYALSRGDVGSTSKNSLQEALNVAISETLQPGLSSPEIVAQDHGSYVSVSVQSGVSTTAPLSISLQIGSVYARETYNGNPSDNPQFVAVSVFNPPTAVIHTGASNAGGGTTFPIDRADGLPASWAQRGHYYGAHHTLVEPFLIGDCGEYLLLLYPSANAPVTQFDADFSGPTFLGVATYASKEPGKLVPEIPQWIERTVSLRQGFGVWSTHWLYALREAVEDSVYLRSGINPDDWEFTDVDAVVAHTENQFSAVSWSFDGTQKLQDVLDVTLRRSGAALAVVNGKLAFGAIAPPTAATVAAAEFVLGDLTLDPVQWGPIDAQIVNVASFKAPGVEVTISDPRSVEEYGLQSSVELRADGCLNAAELARDPRALALSAASKTFFLWGQERKTTSIVVPEDIAEQAQIFSYVKVTLSFVPNAGAHGLSSDWAQVIGREESLDGAWVRLTLLQWDSAPGYSPCVRAAEIQNDSGDGRGCLIAAVAYVGGTSDYAGSERADYSGTANDGGVSRFSVDDTVRLQLIDIAAAYELDLTIDSVEPSGTPGSSKIYFSGTISTSPIDWEAAVAGGAIVHLVHRGYYDGTSSAQAWAWCGDDATGEIDGGPDANQAVAS